MIRRIGGFIHTITSHYLIQVTLVKKVEEHDIPVAEGSVFLIYNNGEIEVTESIKEATVFSFLLGAAVVRRLNKKCATEDLQYELISAGNAQFLADVYQPNGNEDKTDTNNTDFSPALQWQSLKYQMQKQDKTRAATPATLMIMETGPAAKLVRVH